jgi:hypothetical protein
MTSMVAELYEALKKAGVDDETARAAAKAVIGIEQREELATKADILELRALIQTEVHGLRAELIKWNVGAMLALTTIFAAIVKLT